MGDVPYTLAEYDVLAAQVAGHNASSPSSFMVHLGDIKPGAWDCDEAIYQDVSQILLGLEVPTFIVPGDNEWNDCEYPDTAWGFWLQYLSRFEEAWPTAPRVVRQDVRDENFAWQQDGVVFMGINLVGGALHDIDEWTLRLAQDGQWVEEHLAASPNAYAAVIFAHAHPNPAHIAYVNRMEAAAERFARPVLFVHGDGHTWIDDTPFDAENIRRVQVDAGGGALPLQVTVDPDAAEVFTLERAPF